jgi:hypothetical protein
MITFSFNIKGFMVSSSIFKNSLIAFSLVAAIGCGGGGGGGGGGGADEFVGAARVSVRCSPKNIDSGDRTQVSITLSQVHENGIAVKVRFPVGLKYVPSSSFLKAGERELDASPAVNATSETEEMNYVVFYLTQGQFSRTTQEYAGEAGTLLIQLEGRKTVTDGEIEVDPDVDDPAEDNSTEFDITSPEFISEASASISVVAQDDSRKR